MAGPTSGPLRPSDIKYAIYGGLRLERVLYAGWELQPTIGLVAKDIDRLGLELESFAEPIEEAIAYMSESIRRNFESQGRPEHWQPLSEYAVKIRGSSNPILVRSGNLKRVATSFSIWKITPTSASIQDLPAFVWYGILHQGGYGNLAYVARRLLSSAADPRALTDANISKVVQELRQGTLRPTDQRQAAKFVIPARPFIMFQEEDIEAIQDIFIEWMEGKADEVGRSWGFL